ncbi:hypothetical protein [Lysobacter enzymogenes]|uniref:hypothetical protein n=1 Tax=Lysobacter enzymogenes TaxID=69 RepID=UPI0009CE4747|nr:hypothetical protein [Lysobacter enzymogenes]QQQ02106.1 hypothetical protein JHW41_03695 [Lysobacter enzymogenes]UZW61384.1 hypothetical protein BV903_003530 [Lysobacter enzymogenes]
MQRMCAQCGERPVDKDSSLSLLALLTFPLLGILPGARYCKDCGGGQATLAVGVLALAAVIGFVLLVVFW